MNMATAITIAALAALAPVLVTLVGIIMQRQETRDLRSHTDASIADLRSHTDASITALRTEIHSDLAAIRSAMQQFFSITGKLDGRLDEISKR